VHSPRLTKSAPYAQLAGFCEQGWGESTPPDTLSVRMSAQTAIKAPPIPSRSSHSATVRSALWAAWGDALGFPAEMASEQILQQRLGGVETGVLPEAWSRRIGGRLGPTVELPAGCTSDDTQLRLAVGRCIRTTGRFDAETFSKVELPVFLSYQLGAGLGTKAAARALGKRTTRWFSNFFEERSSRYVDGGGNGAAMRIQPHIWAARDAKPDTYLPPLLRDVICTHGHPRGILGACLHAFALATTLHQGAIPGPDRWLGMVDHLAQVEHIVKADEALAERWLPAWEMEDGSFRAAMSKTLDELRHQTEQAIAASTQLQGRSTGSIYMELTKSLGGLRRQTRGAGTITAVLALWLAWASRAEPVDGLRISASLINSDTDTISTMAGALLGSVASNDPPGSLLDRDLIVAEALRLEMLAKGDPAPSFPHPDPLHWRPPPHLADALGLIDGHPAVAGLGPVNPEGDPIPGQRTGKDLWQWVATAYGQSLLIKRRPELRELPSGAQPRSRSTALPNNGSAEPSSTQVSSVRDLPTDPEQGVELFLSSGEDDRLLGRLLRHFARQGHTAAADFAALVAVRLMDR